jgi:hypothetical protein
MPHWTRAVVVASLTVCSAAMAEDIGPLPYLSFADSPFSGLTFDRFDLEDFEDDQLNTPWVTASAGTVTAPGPSTDSVDGDDGAIDGSGTAGRSLIARANFITFTFDPLAPGGLPTHIGIAFTDIGAVAGGTEGFGTFEYRAYNAAGEQVGLHIVAGLGDGLVTGGTAEDKFFGSVDLRGFARLEVGFSNSADWEVDHLQYGVLPTPGAGGLAAVAALLGTRRRRR